MTLAGRYGCVSPARIRGIRDRSTTTTVRGSNTRHIRKPGDQRTFENSMQVRIFSESESFITLLYLDSNDIITLLFPETNIPYLPGGRTTAGAVVCLPDSLGANNEAGFYWDLGPPAGTDTLLLIATSDLDSASRIRRLIHSASPEEEKITMLEGILAQANDWNVINLPIRVLDQ
jgi:hypothetical protein